MFITYLHCLMFVLAQIPFAIEFIIAIGLRLYRLIHKNKRK